MGLDTVQREQGQLRAWATEAAGPRTRRAAGAAPRRSMHSMLSAAAGALTLCSHVFVQAGIRPAVLGQDVPHVPHPVPQKPKASDQARLRAVAAAQTKRAAGPAGPAHCPAMPVPPALSGRPPLCGRAHVQGPRMSTASVPSANTQCRHLAACWANGGARRYCSSSPAACQACTRRGMALGGAGGGAQQAVGPRQTACCPATTCAHGLRNSGCAATRGSGHAAPHLHKGARGERKGEAAPSRRRPHAGGPGRRGSPEERSRLRVLCAASPADPRQLARYGPPPGMCSSGRATISSQRSLHCRQGRTRPSAPCMGEGGGVDRRRSTGGIEAAWWPGHRACRPLVWHAQATCMANAAPAQSGKGTSWPSSCFRQPQAAGQAAWEPPHLHESQDACGSLLSLRVVLPLPEIQHPLPSAAAGGSAGHARPCCKGRKRGAGLRHKPAAAAANCCRMAAACMQGRRPAVRRSKDPAALAALHGRTYMCGAGPRPAPHPLPLVPVC